MSSDDPDQSHLEGGLFAYGGQSVIIWSSLFIVLCTLFVVLRFVSLRIGRRPIGVEDWLIVPAWIIQLGLCVNAICSVLYGGVGRHEKYVLEYQPQALVAWAQTLFVTELLYGLVFPIEKTTILLLYLRLFRIHRWFRITTYVLIAYIWMWGISEVVVAIAQCTPVAFQWDKKIEGGHCIDQLSYYRWVSVPNIIHDVVMLIMPLPVVWTLKLDIRKKLALTGVFLIGSIGCIASFVRLSIFFKLNALSDNTWASIQLHTWTLAETGVILISACLPALWPLVLRAMTGSARSTLRSGLSKGREATETHQSKNNESWRASRPTFMGPTNEFIPLEDIEEHTNTNYRVEGSRGQSRATDHNGINVTTEISWTVSHGTDGSKTSESA
ncbi:hypothetical protein F4802DRAFT_227587 [Xylaria palmicola]|nr:hypothetical protein F4802DRAFT_227587 [Xylaria palmicola]